MISYIYFLLILPELLNVFSYEVIFVSLAPWETDVLKAGARGEGWVPECCQGFRRLSLRPSGGHNKQGDITLGIKRIGWLIERSAELHVPHQILIQSFKWLSSKFNWFQLCPSYARLIVPSVVAEKQFQEDLCLHSRSYPQEWQMRNLDLWIYI